jgi:hypothetical protein
MKKLVNCEIEIGSEGPDFVDSFLHYAEYEDGTVLTDDELDEINMKHSAYVYELVLKQLS